MRRQLIGCLAAILLTAPLWGCGSSRSSNGGATTATTPEAVVRATAYVGADRCGGCHETKHTGWMATAHTKKLRDGSLEANYINDGDNSGRADFFDGTPLDLSTTANFAKFGAKAPILGSDSGGAYAEIDGTKYYIHYTLGGSPKANATAADKNHDGLILNDEAQWKQRYITQIGKSNYILPIQFNAKTGEYVTYDESKWYTDDGTGGYTVTPPAKNDSYERRCAGCHVTGLQVALDGDEWVMSFSDISVACEACHGPGGRHVTSPNKDNIINPATMTTTEDLNGDGTVDQLDNLTVRNYVCFQCHSRGSGKYTAGGTTLAYPSRAGSNGEALMYIPGLDWKDYYDVTTSTSKYWGGAPGTPEFVASKSHHQQQQDFDAGPHAADKPYDHECFVCHDMHDASKGHMITPELEEDGILVQTDNDDNSLCLTCHAGHGPFANITVSEVAQIATNGPTANLQAVVSAHTKHPYDPTGTGASRCSKCHNPKTAKSAIAYDIHSHTFNIIQPSASLSTSPSAGIPNSCSGCHTQLANETADEWANRLQGYYDYLFNGGTTSAAPATNEYVGSAQCGSCHTDQYAEFIESGHNFKLNKVVNAQVPTYPFSDISGFDLSNLQINPNTPNHTAPTDYSEVSYVIGGYGWKARWMYSDGYIFTGPLAQYNLNGTTAAYNNDAAHALQPYNCGNCHTTGWQHYDDTVNPNRQDGLPGIDGTWFAEGVQCEACHGAGKKHVYTLATTDIVKVAALRTQSDYIGTDATITADDTFAYGQAITCGECHTRDGEHDYGTFLSPFEQATGGAQQLGGRIDANGGGQNKHHEQYDEILGIDPDNPAAGSTRTADFQTTKLDCATCHDPHASVKYDSQAKGMGVTKACTDCHHMTFSIAAHAAESCEDCHMPRMSKSAVKMTSPRSWNNYFGDIRTHQFQIDLTKDPATQQFTADGKYTYPWLTSKYACGWCHADYAGHVTTLNSTYGGRVHP